MAGDEGHRRPGWRHITNHWRKQETFPGTLEEGRGTLEGGVGCWGGEQGGFWEDLQRNGAWSKTSWHERGMLPWQEVMSQAQPPEPGPFRAVFFVVQLEEVSAAAVELGRTGETRALL
ncbi:unnamed protein product [Boreogadus saida]